MAFVQIWWRAIKHFNLRGYLYVWANLAFVVLSLPLVTMPAAWAALVRLSHLSQTQHQADLHDFWDAFKANLRRGFILAAISAVVLIINITNLYQYRYETGAFIWLMRSVWMGTLIVWFSLQFYVWTLFYEMREPTLWGALRNAMIMLLQHPFSTLANCIGIVLIALISSIMPVAWLLLPFSFFAVLSTTTTLHHLQTRGYQNPEHHAPLEERI